MISAIDEIVLVTLAGYKMQVQYRPRVEDLPDPETMCLSDRPNCPINYPHVHDGDEILRCEADGGAQ